MQTFEADSINLDFSGRNILSDVYLKMQTGEVVGLLGRNGQGKTCLMQILFGTLKPRFKSLRWNGIHLKTPYLSPGCMCYLPQFSFFPGTHVVRSAFDLLEVDYASFEQFCPEFKQSRDPFLLLSGGQKRLVETYLMIRSNTAFVMLDEPFTHLAPLQVERIKALIQEERGNKGFLISDHMFREMNGFCDRFYLISQGKTHPVEEPDKLIELGYVNSL